MGPLLRRRDDVLDLIELRRDLHAHPELSMAEHETAAEGRYRDAHTLMQEGLRQDETVQAFGDFIQRLGTVADINDLAPTLAR